MRLWRRMVNLLRRNDFDRELEQELEFHLYMKQRENVATARRDMGNLTQAKETSREAWMLVRVETLINDVRYALRVLMKTPLFTVCAVLTLALGIGANAAIFSLIDALLLRGLPVPQPERMIQLEIKGEGFGAAGPASTSLSYPLFEDVKERARSFSEIFAWNGTDLWSGWGAQARRVVGAAVTGGAYQTLGLIPQAGRLFTPADDVSGAPLLAVISDRFWERGFHRDPRAIGQTMVLNRRPFTVVGVTPRNFLGVNAGASPDVTITEHANAALHPTWHLLDGKGSWYLSVVARLKPGVSETQARAELAAISPGVMKDQLIDTEEAARKRFLAQKLDLIPGAAGGSWLARQYRKSLLLLMAISGVVLLLACVNLASLTLARAAPRQKELSVRLALGAGRARLIKQLLTESVVVSMAGAALGTAFAFWATRGLVAFLSHEGSPLVLNLNPDWRVLCFLGILAVSTGLLFGAAPAVQGTDLQPNDALKQTRIGLGRSGRRFQLGKALVSAQVGLSVLLMAGAMLFVQTLEKLKWQNTGFDRNNVVFLELDADNAGLKDAQLARVYDDLLERVRRNPLVRAATLTSVVPVSGSYQTETLDPEFWPHLGSKERTLYIHTVAPDYFRTMGLRLLHGRDFAAGDSSAAEQPGILSASAARTLFPKQDPLGQLLHESKDTTHRIVGIVEDAIYGDLREQSPKTMYLKIEGRPFCNLVIRGELDKAAAASEVRGLLKQTGKDIRLGETVSLTEQIDQALVTERLIALLASFFAALAAALVAIGLYGVVGYSAARRTSEIGVRLALGATRRDVLWLVMREAILLSIIGAAAGIPAALVGGRVAGSMLYGVKANDPVILASTVVLLLTIAAIAGLLPSIRASRLDPMWALRYE
ncbi:MAG: ABC transporter permease [Bryobacteraceae bacterium]